MRDPAPLRPELRRSTAGLGCERGQASRNGGTICSKSSTSDAAHAGGEFGEVALTTLRAINTPPSLPHGRQGALHPRRVQGCGSILRRLEITGRMSNGIQIGVEFIPMHELDEALFGVPWLATTRSPPTETDRFSRCAPRPARPDRLSPPQGSSPT